MKKIFTLLTLAAVSVIGFSCIRNAHNDYSKSPLKEGDAQIMLRLKTPGSFAAAQAKSRSLSYQDENTINDIYVLVFDKTGTLKEIKAGEDATASAGSDNPAYSGEGSFSITLAASKTTADTYRLVVLANASSILTNTIGLDAAAVSNKAYADVMAAIYSSITGPMYAAGGTIPMWGEVTNLVIAPGSSNQSVQLTRSVARIDVGVGAPSKGENDAWSWNGKDATSQDIPFVLGHVYVIRPNNRYAVAANTSASAGDPTVPAGTTAFSVSDSESKFGFSATSSATGGYTSRDIYVPEADVVMGGKPGDANHTGRMAIVVGGYYNGSPTETFYRLDFAKSGDLMNVLRNHLYQFNISKVRGAGFDDVETAYESLAMNMEVEIFDWDETDMGDIVFDGTDYFSISSREVHFTPFGNETQVVKIKTNVPDFSLSLGGNVELKAGSKLTYTSTAQNYQYTLAQTGSDSYTLTVLCPDHNVSNSVPDRRELWTIVAKRLSMSFTVDQQWTNLYISIVDGQSAKLYPEGTNGTAIPINILAFVPVTITVAPAETTWIEGLDAPGLTTPDGQGFYSAALELTVAPFRYDIDGTANRSATITITPRNEDPIVYTISQEAPYIRFNKGNVLIPRPVAAPSSATSTSVDVITNILPEDLSLTRISGTGTGNALITLGGDLYGLNAMRPRYQRFDVSADLTGTLPVNGFSALFEVAVKSTLGTKYGTVDPASVSVGVPSDQEKLTPYWYRADFGLGTYPWTAATRYTDAAQTYVFPWNATEAAVDVLSNLECAFDAAGSTLGNGTVTPGTEIGVSGDVAYPYTFTFNNDAYSTVGSYALKFNSVTPAGTTQTLNFKQGVQVFQRGNLANTAVNYAGWTEAAGQTLVVTSNVDWTVALDSWNPSTPADWLKLRLGSSGSYSVPSASSPIAKNDRFMAPVAYAGDYAANAASVLTAASTLYVSADAMALNATPTVRTAEIGFTNLSHGGPKGGAATGTPITVTQYAPVLTLSSSTLPAVGAIIPHTATTITFNGSTNLQNSGIKVYVGNDNTGTLLINGTSATTGSFGAGATINSAAAAVARNTSVTIPARTATETAERVLAFYLYNTHAGIASETLLGTWTQAGYEIVGVHSAPGVIGYYASGPKKGQLTLLGSSFYKGDPNIDRNDGKLSDETVYVAYFKWASLVAIGSQPAPSSSFNSTNIIWAPAGYKGTATPAAALAQVIADVGNTWSAVPFRTGADNQSNGWNQIAGSGTNEGIGDPCAFYFGTASVESMNEDGWRMPVGGTNGWNGGGNFGKTNYTAWASLASGGKWVSTSTTPSAPYAGAVSGDGDGGQDWSMYLPATGYRSTPTGTVSTQGSLGNYWSSTGGGSTVGYYLSFSSSSENPADSRNYANGHAVRCVR